MFGWRVFFFGGWNWVGGWYGLVCVICWVSCCCWWVFLDEIRVEVDMLFFFVYLLGFVDIVLLYDIVLKFICFVGGLGVVELYVNVDWEFVCEMVDVIVEVDEVRLVVDGEVIGERWVGLEVVIVRFSFWWRLDLDLWSIGWVMVGSWVVNEWCEVGCCFCCGFLV